MSDSSKADGLAYLALLKNELLGATIEKVQDPQTEDCRLQPSTPEKRRLFSSEVVVFSKIPFKVLDAPELQDDFYLNLVDWSSLNVLSVGYLWSACTSQLLVWNHSSALPVQQYTEHLAAVKAIAWSPHQHGLLASGGGTADRCFRFWNTLTGQTLQCTDTGSQVCNLAWSRHTNELVSTHGYSQNQILVWK